MDDIENRSKRVMVSVRLDEDMVEFLDKEVKRRSKDGFELDRSKIIRHAVELYRDSRKGKGASR